MFYKLPRHLPPMTIRFSWCWAGTEICFFLWNSVETRA